MFTKQTLSIKVSFPYDTSLTTQAYIYMDIVELETTVHII